MPTFNVLPKYMVSLIFRSFIKENKNKEEYL